MSKSRKPAAPSVSEVVAILDHDRTRTSWVLAPVIGADGKPAIRKVARIAYQYPRDGAGTLKVAVTDWTDDTVRHHVGKAGGCGYDKRTAATCGAFVGGFELGDHCDHLGRPTLDVLCAREGWEVIGG